METPPTTQGSGDHKTIPTVTMVISDKKRTFEDQQVGSGVPVVDHSNVTSKLSSKKFFGRKGGEYVCISCVYVLCVSVCVSMSCIEHAYMYSISSTQITLCTS